MKETADILGWQLESRPVANRAVAAETAPDGKLRLSLPLEATGWLKAARLIFPLSNIRRVELDDLGAELYRRCDGEQTLEELIDWLARVWKLSFFEARGLVLQVLRPLVKYGMVAVAVKREP